MQAEIKRTIPERKAQLEAQKAVLLARLHAIERDLDVPADKDWEEAAIEREDDEVLEQTGLVAQRELQQIEAALHRIETGEYGSCLRCGASISDARLDVVPHTAFCKDCAK
jgi:RNA polymerase-binding transcription factor DksA